jgi:all-trans-retinol 13,14-reductase
MSGEEMMPWFAGCVGSRPDGYDAAKRGMTRKIISVLRHKWPEQDELNVVDTFSPLTIRDYTLSPAGSCYGLPPSRFIAAARIAGFFPAGQSIEGPGVLGAIISAINACGKILGRQLLLGRIESSAIKRSYGSLHHRLEECSAYKVSG